MNYFFGRKSILSLVLLVTSYFMVTNCSQNDGLKLSGNHLIDSLSTDTSSVNPFIDSMRYLLPSVNETQRIDILNRLSEEYRNVDPAFQKRLWKEAISLSEKNTYKVGIADALHNEGISLYKQFKFDSAMVSLNKSLKMARETGDKRVIALALSWQAEIQRALKNTVESDQPCCVFIVAAGQLIPDNHHRDAPRESDQNQAHHVFRVAAQEDDCQQEHQDRSDDPVL